MQQVPECQQVPYCTHTHTHTSSLMWLVILTKHVRVMFHTQHQSKKNNYIIIILCWNNFKTTEIFCFCFLGYCDIILYKSVKYSFPPNSYYFNWCVYVLLFLLLLIVIINFHKLFFCYRVLKRHI